MRLVSFLQAGEERLGLLHGDAIIDPLLASGDRALFGSALAFIRSGERGDRGRAGDPGRCVNQPLLSAHAGRAAAAVDDPVQRQQLPGPQRREGQHADQRQGAGVFRQDRGLRGRPRRAHRVRSAALEEARLRGRARHRDRQARPSYPGRARARSRVRLHHRQRCHRARPPGAAHARGHDLVRARQRQGLRTRARRWGRAS